LTLIQPKQTYTGYVFRAASTNWQKLAQKFKKSKVIENQYPCQKLTRKENQLILHALPVELRDKGCKSAANV
jgi:hypothetical protein